MNLHYRPSRLADRRFPPHVKALAVYTEEEELLAQYEPDTLQVTQVVPMYTDPDLLAEAVVDGVRKAQRRMDDALEEMARVADLDGIDAVVNVRITVKAWPSLPGITVPGSQEPMTWEAS